MYCFQEQMAHNLDDPEFWFPPLFPSAESVTQSLMSESNSGFSSPVDSSVASTETESVEDEFLSELTRRLASSTHLSHDLWKPKPTHGLLPYEKTNTSWKAPTFPQFSICNEKAPKTTIVQQDIDTSHLQYWSLPRSQEPCHNYVLSNPRSHAYHSNQHILYHPCQQNGFVGKMQQQNVVKNGNCNGHAIGLSPYAWPTLQQSQSHKQPLPVSWNRAAILGNNLIKRDCSGTGVFFPRPVARTPSQAPRKKQPVSLKQRNVTAQTQQKKDTSGAHAGMDNEIRLPQEWTY